MSIKSILTLAMGAILTLALTGAGALIELSTLLHTAAVQLGDAMKSVRLVEELEVELLAEGQSSEPVSPSSQRILRDRIAGMKRYSTSAEEDALVKRVAEGIEAYLVTSGNGGGEHARARALGAAQEPLQELVRLNVEQARSARQDAQRWDEIADRTGTIVAALLVFGVLATLLWLNAAALAPMRRIAQAVERFGQGDRGARLLETGPTELREMARHFNTMAAALGRQQENQLAFLAGVAHDLRNPISALKLTAGMVRPGRPLPPEDAIRETIAIVLGQTDRLERMVGDLLDSARIEAGHLEIRPQRLDLRTVAQSALDLYRPTAPLHALELAIPEAPVWVDGDAARLEQVLNNLVSNAVKYSPGGGRVDVKVCVDGPDAVIDVRDEGVGMGADEQRRLFEPFQRGGRLRDSVPGVGIGLSVVRRIVAGHGGTIQVESALGHGTRFTVRIPAGAAPLA